MTRALGVINDQSNIISNFTRQLSLVNNSVFREQNKDDESSLERIRNTEDNIEKIRKKITMDIVEIDNLISYREDVVRTIYIIDKITGIISGIPFRLFNLKISILKQAKCNNDIITIIRKFIEYVCKLHEMIRGVSINQKNIIELTHEIQKLDSRIDSKDRNILIKAFHGIENTKELILFEGTCETIEDKK
jgi:uncharacterized protein Yka (UPF0111/DUF47 family)